MFKKKNKKKQEDLVNEIEFLSQKTDEKENNTENLEENDTNLEQINEEETNSELIEETSEPVDEIEEEIETQDNIEEPEESYEDIVLDDEMNEEITIDEDTQELDKKLLLEYIEKNQKKILTRKFSIPGFFFGSLYLIYRKLYFIGLPLYFLNVFLINYFNNSFIVSIVFIIINLFIACSFNKLYLNHCYKNIVRIKNLNKEKDEESIISICRNKGGKSVSKLFICILLIGLISGGLILYKDKINDLNLFNIEKEEDKIDEFDINDDVIDDSNLNINENDIINDPNSTTNNNPDQIIIEKNNPTNNTNSTVDDNNANQTMPEQNNSNLTTNDNNIR